MESNDRFGPTNRTGFSPYITSRVVLILIPLMVALLVGFLATYETNNLLAFAPAGFFGVFIALIRRKIAVALFYLSVFVPSGYIVRYFASVPVVILWLPHLLLLCALLAQFFNRQKTQAIKHPWPISLMWVGLIWVIVSFLSLLANGGNPLAAILSLRGIFLIYGTILVYRLQFSAYDREHLIRNLVFMGLIMLPVSIIQRIFVVDPLRLDGGDMVTGLFTTDTDLVFFQLFCILVVVSWWLSGRRLLPISPPILIFLLFIPLAIGNSKAAPIYFCLVTGFLFWQYRTRVSRRMLSGLLVFASLGVAGTFVFDQIYQTSYNASYSVVERYYNVDGALSYLLSTKGTYSGGLQRGAAVIFNYTLIKKEPLSLLLGLSPGALSDSRVPGGTGHIFAKYPLLALNNNSLATVLGELGFAGICLLGGLLLGLFFLGDTKEAFALIALRKSVAALLALMLIYSAVLLSPVVALVFAVLCIQTDSYKIE